MSDNNRVIVYKMKKSEYPKSSPFHPSFNFPEYPFGDINNKAVNEVYSSIRKMFRLQKLDIENFDKQVWNPLKSFISPGNSVVIKPNLVISEHYMGKPGIECSVVHGSVIRALADYIFIALENQGKITIADSPIKEVDFEKIISFLGINKIQKYYSQNTNIKFEVLDFRDVKATRNAKGVIISSVDIPGDPSGYQVVDLSENSYFSDVDIHYKRYRSTATVYENVINEYHRPGVHKYSIPNTILKADTIINLSKLKTHRYTGVTLGLKNLIGITNEKRHLPHFRIGCIDDGGDSLPSNPKKKFVYSRFLKDKFASNWYGKFGSRYIFPSIKFLYNAVIKYILKKEIETHFGYAWYNNDTVWRTSLDLNKIVKYVNSKGNLEQKQQRNILNFIDGVVGGHREAPLNSEPQRTGLLFFGLDTVAVDIVASRLMGFDYRKIPKIIKAIKPNKYQISNIDHTSILTNSNDKSIHNKKFEDLPSYDFEANPGWKGHIEFYNEPKDN